MLKGCIPPFKKINKNIIKITKERSFQPNLLIDSFFKKEKNKKNE